MSTTLRSPPNGPVTADGGACSVACLGLSEVVGWGPLEVGSLQRGQRLNGYRMYRYLFFWGVSGAHPHSSRLFHHNGWKLAQLGLECATPFPRFLGSLLSYSNFKALH